MLLFTRSFITMSTESNISSQLTTSLERDYTQPCKSIQKFEGHSEGILVLTVLSDGRLISGSADSTIKLWDVNSGQCLQTLRGHNTYVHALAILSNGRLASGDQQGIIKIWDLNTGNCLQTLSNDSHWITALAALPDGRLASSSKDKKNIKGKITGKKTTIDVWDVNSGQCVQTLSGHSNSIVALVSLPNGRLASGSYDYSIKIWDPNTGKCLQTLSDNAWIHALTVLPDGRLASGFFMDNPIKLWDLNTGKSVQTFSENPGNHIIITPLQDSYLASSSNDKIIKLWNVNSGQCVQTLSEHKDSIWALVGLPDGRLAIGYRFDKTIELREFPELKLKETLTFTKSSSYIISTDVSVTEIKEPMPKKIDEDGAIKISITIPYNQLTLGKELGRGGFGIVYEGQYQYGQVAIKTLLHQELKDSLVEDFKKEAFMMANLRSPFIVSLYGVCLEKPHYSIVMEYMSNGSLSNLLQNQKPFEWKIRYQIGIDVGGGLAYLHNHEMIHCDLKSLNILLDVNHRAKISDFGLSKVKLETSFSTVSGGSTRWMAPELFDEGAKSTKAADVFAFGVILWELGARKFPFATTRNEAVPLLVLQGKREKVTADTPPTMAQLIGKCWDGRAENRPKIDEAVKTLQAEQVSYKF
jgi:WD40 repeat protein